MIGCQKMTELSTAEILALMGRVGEVQWESVFGTTFPGYYAMFAARHMHEFGTTREQLAAVAVKNHHYGAANPKAMFQKEITLEKALRLRCGGLAPDRLRLLRQRRRRRLRHPGRRSHARAVGGDRVVWLDGVGCATDSMSVLRRQRPDRTAGRARCRGTGLRHGGRHAPATSRSPRCTTASPSPRSWPTRTSASARSGEGGAFVDDRQSYVGGRHPVNVDGGLKAKGHPIGATGVSMTYEIVAQLRGECGERQVPGAAVGLTHNVGGIGQYCFVNVLRRD